MFFRVCLGAFLLVGTFVPMGSSGSASAQDTTPVANVIPVDSQPAEVGYHHGFFIQGADGSPYRLQLNGRIQGRYTYSILDQNPDESAFTIQRARFAFSGIVFTQNLGYKLEIDFGRGSFTLKDAWVDYRFSDSVRLQVGQFKTPFSRHQLSSSGRQLFVDRAITDHYFGAGRDIGVMLHNGFSHSPEFEYAVGIFNGASTSSRFEGDVMVDASTGAIAVDGGFTNVPDQVRPSVVFRVGYNRGQLHGYDEVDFAGGPLRFGVGLSGRLNFDHGDANDGSIAFEMDAMVKISGFSASSEFYVLTAQDGSGSFDQSFDAWGLMLQAGYLIGERFQPMVRYARVAPTGSNNDRQEILGGVNVFFFGHNLKWTTDAGALLEDAMTDGIVDLRLRTQLQLGF